MEDICRAKFIYVNVCRTTQFYAMVEFTTPAVPLLIDKIEKNPEDFHLMNAVRCITKKRFERSDWPPGKIGDSITAAKMFIQWWKDGRFRTGERFGELHDKWKTLKSEK